MMTNDSDDERRENVRSVGKAEAVVAKETGEGGGGYWNGGRRMRRKIPNAAVPPAQRVPPREVPSQEEDEEGKKRKKGEKRMKRRKRRGGRGGVRYFPPWSSHGPMIVSTAIPPTVTSISIGCTMSFHWPKGWMLKAMW